MAGVEKADMNTFAEVDVCIAGCFAPKIVQCVKYIQGGIQGFYEARFLPLRAAFLFCQRASSFCRLAESSITSLASSRVAGW